MSNKPRRDLVPVSIAPFPHCDDCVLHAPGACEVCDTFPDMQNARIAWGINFTGEHDEHLAPCPAETRRLISTIERWADNRPLKPDKRRRLP